MSDDPIRRAERAKALLSDDVLTDAFAQVRADILSEWENTRRTYTVKREKLWCELKALDAVRAKLHGVVMNGKILKAR